MKTLKTHIMEGVSPLHTKTIFQRLAARGIVTRGETILLMYTERYLDYSLPGGGVDSHEGIVDGLAREMSEETGATNIRNIQPLGVYEEYRPWHKPEFDVVHMMSYCFWCDIDEELGEASLEEYEVKNGMKALWINIHDAIAYNKETMASSEKKGMSIERETFLLELIAKEINRSKTLTY